MRLTHFKIPAKPEHMPKFSSLITVISVIASLVYSSVNSTYAENKKNNILAPSQQDNIKTEQIDKRAKKLLDGIDALLQQTARYRNGAQNLPRRSDFFVAVPPWAETREDRETIIRELMDSALEIVTDSPITEYQTQLKKRQATIVKLKDQITTLQERRLDAPKDSLLPSLLTETVSSIDENIKELNTRIEGNQEVISDIKAKIMLDFQSKNIDISPEQLDLLLGSVLGNDIVKLVAAFDAAKVIDTRLGKLMAQNNESLKSARRYFAMHAALFAMLLHAQNELVAKIDTVYLKKLNQIISNIRTAKRKTTKLLRQKNRPDQRRILLANRKSQAFSEKVASFYRDYLRTQRNQILKSRRRTLRDLSIADNTYETVEASFQLHTLIEESKSSFRAIERLEAPGFDQIFQNDQLRREFEKLTEKLNIPSS
ncbi:MAG: hypothetical protein AAF228_00260 [Pseudomonadota bacterium]